MRKMVYSFVIHVLRRRATAVGSFLESGAQPPQAWAMPGRGERRVLDAADLPTRRLRQKTTVGHLALGVAVVALAAPVSAADWQQPFLQAEGLEAEDKERRKAVYLVTLPHPQAACPAQANAGLKAPGDFSRQEMA